MKSIIVGMAGHIDHGKTTLVRALTGIDADRLPEEKATRHHMYKKFKPPFLLPGAISPNPRAVKRMCV